jgi:hypothetical protein
MAYVSVRRVFYSLKQKRECDFELTYEVSEGPTPGLKRRFLVDLKETICCASPQVVPRVVAHGKI